MGPYLAAPNHRNCSKYSSVVEKAGVVRQSGGLSGCFWLRWINTMEALKSPVKNIG
jgi:hypothetical protein